MKRILIDTNIYSLALRGDEKVVDTLRHAERIGFSSMSVGELLSGFKGGKKEQVNRKELETFLDAPRTVLYPVDEYTAEYYSSIINQLRQDGTPIPTNDIWIAATSFQYGLQLYTADKHFYSIAGLMLEFID